jgi:type IV pilus assembly protein PilP
MIRILFYLAFSLLVACSSGSDVADLEEFVSATTSKPKGRIPALPEFKPYSAFTYGASALRSPFKSPVIFEEMAAVNQSLVVAPDENRPKDPLERYSLGELTFVGTVAKDGNNLKALIKTAQGSVLVTEVGAYMGKNNGRIVNVSESQLDIAETVPNGKGGWISRPQSLGLAESGGN